MATWTPEYRDKTSWYDPLDANTTVVGSKISEAADLGPAALNFAQSDDAKRPTDELDGAGFAGGQALTNGSASFPAACTVIVALRIDTLPASTEAQTVFRLKSSGNLFFELFAANVSGYQPWCFRGAHLSSGGSVGVNRALSAGEELIIALTYNGGTNTATGSYTCSINGTAETPVTTGNIGASSGDLAAIGGRASSTNAIMFGLKGVVREVLIADSVLPDEEIQVIVGYLAHKGGNASILPGGHPYKTTAPQAIIFGNRATVETGTGDPVTYVTVFEWTTGLQRAVLTPDVNGDWEYGILADQSYGLTYVRTTAGIEPSIHGPYEL